MNGLMSLIIVGIVINVNVRRLYYVLGRGLMSVLFVIESYCIELYFILLNCILFD